MKKLSSIIIVLFILFSLSAQDKRHAERLYIHYYDAFNNGNYHESLEYLKELLEFEGDLSDELYFYTYQGLGLIYTTLSVYDRAIEYYREAEKYCDGTESLIRNYNATALLYSQIGDAQEAHLFYGKALQLVEEMKAGEHLYAQLASMLNLNYGILLLNLKEYEDATRHLKNALILKRKYDLKHKAGIYLNLAKLYRATNEASQASRYYLKAIEYWKKEYYPEYYQIAGTYIHYSDFLMQQNKMEEAKRYLENGLAIYVEKFGEKHSLTSHAYNRLSKWYLDNAAPVMALKACQKSIIAISPDFNEDDYHHNPAIDYSLKDIRLMENLQLKARILNSLASSKVSDTKKMTYLEFALSTVKLSLELKEKVRNSFNSRESRLFLAENEKGMHVDGMKYALKLHELSRQKKYLEVAYRYASGAKAAELSWDMHSKLVIQKYNSTDSLLQKLQQTEQEMRKNYTFLQLEYEKSSPDKAKLEQWKNDLFELNSLHRDLLDESSNRNWYRQLYQKPEVPGLSDIQAGMNSRQTLLEYVYYPKGPNGEAVFFAFIITKWQVKYQELRADSYLSENLAQYRDLITNNPAHGISPDEFNHTVDVLNVLYLQVFEPVESQLGGREIIVIPDDKLHYLSFGSLVSKSEKGDIINFSGLHYLIKKYCFSYAYSSSLLYRDEKPSLVKPRLTAFAPVLEGTEGTHTMLSGTERELKYLEDHFKGSYFYGDDATKRSFLELADRPFIFHFAMHAETEKKHVQGSSLIFASSASPDNAQRLYDYEISTLNIQSPLIALSACNSGSGLLNRGEGMLSLTRSFTEAGGRAVVNSLWPADDEASAFIMKYFYRELALGQKKNIALNEATNEYLLTSPPAFNHPYYWAGFRLQGNVEALVLTPFQKLGLGGLITLILVVGIIGGRRLIKNCRIR